MLYLSSHSISFQSPFKHFRILIQNNSEMSVEFRHKMLWQLISTQISEHFNERHFLCFTRISFECSTYNNKFFPVSKYICLISENLSSSLTISASPDEIVWEGQSIRLDCKVSGLSPTAEVVWLRAKN